MSTQPASRSSPPEPMMKWLHEARRDEVMTRYLAALALDPVAPALQSQWDDVHQAVFKAVYDFHDVMSEHDEETFKKDKRQAIEAMMDHHLVDDLPAAEKEFQKLADKAKEATAEVHATAKAREVFHRVTPSPNRRPDEERDQPIRHPKHDEPVGTVPPYLNRPFADAVKPTAPQEPQKRITASMESQVRDYFHYQNERFWQNNESALKMQKLYDESSLSANDVDLALYQHLSPHKVDVTHVPVADENSHGIEQVLGFLTTEWLIDDATHAWLLKQFEDKYIAVVQDVTRQLDFKPGRIGGGQLAMFNAEVEKQLASFKQELSAKQEAIMGDDESAEFSRDSMILEASMKRALEGYLIKGPKIEERRHD